MRIFILCLLLFLIHETKAQLIEDFSDGNFTSNPTWNGDNTQFIINTQQQLQLNSSGTDISSLSAMLTQNTLDSLEWRCYVSLNFSPSSSNFGRIYLVSDSPNLEGPLNGYFIQLGESLSGDAVELFEQSQNTLTSIARGTNGLIANSFSIGIRVTRGANGIWKLFVDYTGGTNYLFEASGNNNTYNSSAYFGVYCKYTTSNSSAFSFDDFYAGPLIVDSIPPVISQVNVTSSSTVDVKFNEQVENVSAQTVLNYFVDNGIGNPITVQQDVSDLSLVHLSFSNSLTPSIIYKISISNVMDINNNIIAPGSTFSFALPDTARQGDIVINEILFNPFSGGSDFVELYNNSSKVIDLSKLKIANTDLNSGAIDVSSPIATMRTLFYPGDYVVLTENTTDIKSRYVVPDPKSLLNIADLPSYNDDEGECILLDASLNTIDRFHYLDNYHFPLLNDKEGVSLERINPDRVSQDSSNWHSASTSSGFATPGYKNSQYSVSFSDGSEINVDPEIFSPDNDGQHDIINFHYKFEKPGYTANVKIFNSRGVPVIELVKSELLGTEEGTWSWDGIDKDHQKAAIGIYVIYIEAFSTTGEVKKIKKTCVLASKL